MMVQRSAHDRLISRAIHDRRMRAGAISPSDSGSDTLMAYEYVPAGLVEGVADHR